MNFIRHGFTWLGFMNLLQGAYRKSISGSCHGRMGMRKRGKVKSTGFLNSEGREAFKRKEITLNFK